LIAGIREQRAESISEFKRNYLAGEWRNLRNEELNWILRLILTKRSNREDGIGSAYSMHGEVSKPLK
jgi:hypothetical protein